MADVGHRDTMNETLITVFIIVTAVAVVLQMAILFALYLGTKKTSARVEALAKQVEEKALPVLTQANEMIVEYRPKVTTIIENLHATSTTVREQSERINVTLNDVIDRTRLQVIRADEIVSRSMDRVEETAEAVHHVVLSPVRQMSAVVTGLLAGVGEYVGGRKVRRTREAVPQDEMFI
jgi:methyl-accepting chemotaxis protein